ncbi:MAG: TAXI family TRAP transporter solute-binding subunit [Desulfitobacteriaceae bacterium]|nr:TAXI family TRAP transporter solute-binding subunit [Desulfitobacteriaceae bacterium]MDI6913597.1 TAXI family TRAP transporter solute-binding subunit [Desulfitobacteriaceae bacterium]
MLHKRGKLVSIFSILALVVLMLSGCGSTQPAAAPGGQNASSGQGTQSTSVKTTKLAMGTGGTSGTYYYIGAGMSKMFKEFTPQIELSAEVTAAGLENIRLLSSKQIDMGLDDVPTMTIFEKNNPGKLAEMRQLTGGHSMFAHIIVPDNSPIKSVKDMKGKKVMVGAAGSGNEVGVQNILGLYGMTEKDITPMFLNYTEATDAFKDGQLDAYFLITGTPAVALTDLQTTKKVRLIELEPDVLARVEKGEITGGFKMKLPANTYKNQPNDMYGFGINTQLIVRADMPDDVAYTITKTIAEHWQTIKDSHPAGEEWQPKPEYIFRGANVPFHPGAVKYFKEAGLWDKRPSFVKP